CAASFPSAASILRGRSSPPAAPASPPSPSPSPSSRPAPGTSQSMTAPGPNGAPAPTRKWKADPSTGPAADLTVDLILSLSKDEGVAPKSGNVPDLVVRQAHHEVFRGAVRAAGTILASRHSSSAQSGGASCSIIPASSSPISPGPAVSTTPLPQRSAC